MYWGKKINNLWILLKKSLTLWLFPVFIVSLFVKPFTISAEYIYWLAVLYIFIVLINYLKKNIVLFLFSRLLLIFLSLIVFTNNVINFKELILNMIILFLCVIGLHIFFFFLYNRKNKSFILNFYKINCFIEMIFAVSLLFCGIKSFVTLNILFFAMCDIIYKILILSVILNLNKRFFLS